MKSLIKFAVLFVYLTTYSGSYCAKILGIFPHYGISHWKVSEPLLEELIARGHELVVISPYALSRNSSKYTHVNMGKMIKVTGSSFMDIGRVSAAKPSAWTRQKLLAAMAEEVEHCLGHEDVHEVLNSTFDLALIEMFNTEVFFSLIHKMNLPAVGIVCHAVNPWVNSIASNPEHPSFVPGAMSTVSIPMAGLLDRLQNTLEVLLSKLAARLYTSWRSQIKVDAILNETQPELTTVARNSLSVVLINSHFSIFGPAPFLPSMIEVGGLNVVPVQPLPKDLKKIMDESANGVIYFSMGSALNSGIDERKLQDFKQVFSELNQTVLWKYDPINDAPSNVHVMPWFPQRDILAHPNLVLFISHCGLLSINEAVTDGVPVLCIPIYGDQHYNSKHLQTTGMSMMFNYGDITYASLKEVIVKMIYDANVKEAAKKVSATFTDRPMSPLNTAVFWVEYVIRHGGARHLLPPGRDLNSIQFYNIDVVFVILLSCSIILYCLKLAIFILLKIILRSYRRLTGKNVKTKND